MGDTGRGAAGGVDHDFDLGCCDQCHGIVAKMGAALACGLREASGRQRVGRPAGMQQGFAGASG
jgi:hypothetical protein